MAKVFFSYSHKDEELRDALDTHFASLKREELIDSWHDRRIVAGDDIDEEVFAALDEAQIILLLVSADFINSHYCYSREMVRAMDRHNSKDARVIPVILRHCDWQNTPFGKLRALPRDGKPITSWQNRDEAMLEVTREVRRALENANSQSRQESSASSGTRTVVEALALKGEKQNILSSNNEGVIFLSCDVLAEEGEKSRTALISAYNKLEAARISERQHTIRLTSSEYDSLLEKDRKISAGALPNDLGETELALAKERKRLEKLAIPLNAIANERHINSWLSSANERADLALQFIKLLNNAMKSESECTDFELVLKPKLDVSFVFDMPNSVINHLVKKNGFENCGGERMITSMWGFDIFDLPLEMVRSEILPRLIQLVYLPRHEGLKRDYSDDHLLDLGNWTFGLR